MSRCGVVLGLIGVLVACACGEAGGKRSSKPLEEGFWDEALRREVLRMHEKDQEARQALIDLLRAGISVGTVAIQRLAATQDSVDWANARRLEEIVRANGWPTNERTGKEAVSAAFTIGISDADADRPSRFAPGAAEHPGRVPATLPEATR